MARVAKQKQGSRFVQLSATTSGVSNVKEAIAAAKNDRRLFKQRTILFIDEIHRFNKLQQVIRNMLVPSIYLALQTDGNFRWT